jgi:hypothetical protein
MAKIIETQIAAHMPVMRTKRRSGNRNAPAAK